MTSTSQVVSIVMIVVACPFIGYAGAVGLTLLTSSIIR
jgi:hypothetical protein